MIPNTFQLWNEGGDWIQPIRERPRIWVWDQPNSAHPSFIHSKHNHSCFCINETYLSNPSQITSLPFLLKGHQANGNSIVWMRLADVSVTRPWGEGHERGATVGSNLELWKHRVRGGVKTIITTTHTHQESGMRRQRIVPTKKQEWELKPRPENDSTGSSGYHPVSHLSFTARLLKNA